jgi:hypothetical protein
MNHRCPAFAASKLRIRGFLAARKSFQTPAPAWLIGKMLI